MLGWPGPVLAAYLGVLKQSGLTPRKVIRLRFSKALGPRLKQIERAFGEKYAYHLHDVVQRIRVERILRHPFGKALQAALGQSAGFSWKFEKQQCPVEDLYAEDFRCASVAEKLLKEPYSTFLFSGGGILPKELLAHDSLRFIHVHPGIVPEIKGSDGLLWSALLRQKLGASCFYMNSGIDTGDIIGTKEYSLPCIPRDKARSLTVNQLVNMLTTVYDPLMRADCLAEALHLKSLRDGSILPTGSIQDPAAGRTYHYMRMELKSLVIDRFLQGDSQRVNREL